MFTDKLQNPFLKPSPFGGSLNSGSSYLNSDPAPRYQSYKPYQQPRANYMEVNTSYNTTKYDKPSSYQQNRASHTPRTFQSQDIQTILSKNPFNRSYQPSFAQERGPRDLSPGKVSYNALQPRSSHQTFEDYNANPYNYDYSRVSSNNNARISDTPSHYTPARNNYLSTSSADSATTYIDKIYDLGDDRGQHETKHLSNPFNRKTLMGNSNNAYERAYQRQSAKNMDYDMGFLKFASLAYQEENARAPSLNLDSYDGSYHNKYPPTPNNYENTYPVTNSTYKEEPKSSYKEEPPRSTYKDEPRIGNSNLQRGLTFGQEKPTSYGSMKDRYQTAPYQDNYTSNYDPEPNYKNVYDSYKYTQQIPKPQASQYEKDYEQPRFGTKGSNKYNSYEYERSKNYDNYESNNYKNDYADISQPEKFNFDDPGNDYMAEQDKRVRFSEKSQESRQSNYQDYGKFETLGGQPFERDRGYDYAPREPDSGSFAKYPANMNKLASSQVDEYTSPDEIQKKIKQSKYNQLGIENPARSSSKFAEPLPVLGKAPTRDSSEQFPRVLELNGILFHKIEVA